VFVCLLPQLCLKFDKQRKEVALLEELRWFSVCYSSTMKYALRAPTADNSRAENTESQLHAPYFQIIPMVYFFRALGGGNWYCSGQLRFQRSLRNTDSVV
jgi:hypothetical protein